MRMRKRGVVRMLRAVSPVLNRTDILLRDTFGFALRKNTTVTVVAPSLKPRIDAALARAGTEMLQKWANLAFADTKSSSKKNRNKSGELQPLSEEEKMMAKSIFERFDTDNSGTIDFDELGIAMREMGKKMSEVQLYKMMKKVDADGGGDISIDEFCKMLQLAK